MGKSKRRQLRHVKSKREMGKVGEEGTNEVKEEQKGTANVGKSKREQLRWRKARGGS